MHYYANSISVGDIKYSMLLKFYHEKHKFIGKNNIIVGVVNNYSCVDFIIEDVATNIQINII